MMDKLYKLFERFLDKTGFSFGSFLFISINFLALIIYFTSSKVSSHANFKKDFTEKESLVQTINLLRMENSTLREELKEVRSSNQILLETPQVKSCLDQVLLESKIREAKRNKSIIEKEGLTIEEYKELMNIK